MSYGDTHWDEGWMPADEALQMKTNLLGLCRGLLGTADSLRLYAEEIINEYLILKMPRRRPRRTDPALVREYLITEEQLG